jgi:hypothetical protein
MELELIKLKVKKEASTGSVANFIESKFIECCEKLDASIFEPLIAEEQYFQELDKYRFLQSVKDEFDRLKLLGIFKTIMIDGKCNGCHLGHKAVQFYGKRHIPEFSYIIHKENGEIEDIFMCNLSNGMQVVEMATLLKYKLLG